MGAARRECRGGILGRPHPEGARGGRSFADCAKDLAAQAEKRRKKLLSRVKAYAEGGPFKGGDDPWLDAAVLMDLLEIDDYHVLARQPAEIVDWRLEILEKRGAFQAKQADRAAKTSSRPPDDIERSD